MKKIWFIGFLAFFLSVGLQTVRAQTPDATNGRSVVGENGVVFAAANNVKGQKFFRNYNAEETNVVVKNFFPRSKTIDSRFQFPVIEAFTKLMAPTGTFFGRGDYNVSFLKGIEKVLSKFESSEIFNGIEIDNNYLENAVTFSQNLTKLRGVDMPAPSTDVTSQLDPIFQKFMQDIKDKDSSGAARGQ